MASNTSVEPARPNRRPLLIGLAAAAVLIVAVGAYFLRGWGASSFDSVAVLPFVAAGGAARRITSPTASRRR
jgi:hypothetical protein